MHVLISDTLQATAFGCSWKKTSKGGIDFTAHKIPLETHNNGREIKFKIDRAMLQQLQDLPGFIPQIIDVQPLQSLPAFLGLSDWQRL